MKDKKRKIEMNIIFKMGLEILMIIEIITAERVRIFTPPEIATSQAILEDVRIIIMFKHEDEIMVGEGDKKYSLN